LSAALLGSIFSHPYCCELRSPYGTMSGCHHILFLLFYVLFTLPFLGLPTVFSIHSLSSFSFHHPSQFHVLNYSKILFQSIYLPSGHSCIQWTHRLYYFHVSLEYLLSLYAITETIIQQVQFPILIINPSKFSSFVTLP